MVEAGLLGAIGAKALAISKVISSSRIVATAMVLDALSRLFNRILV